MKVLLTGLYLGVLVMVIGFFAAMLTGFLERIFNKKTQYAKDLKKHSIWFLISFIIFSILSHVLN
ncbi:hypothetical protein Dip518_000623 [Parelusimicrobium proximum]|uniref:hypothetical protein n=1 Tax=Parelusimicrobium proximum TaxID=3228953 RepID=UPI003D170453